MGNVVEQVHGKFKVFTGALATDGTLGTLDGEVESWVRSAKVAPKSIGVEYLESAEKLVLSIGYRDDEAPYAVKLQSVHIGKVAALDAASLGKLEKDMASSSARLENIICHELYVTAENDLFMVFMTHEAG